MNIQIKIILVVILFISIFSANYYFFTKKAPTSVDTASSVDTTSSVDTASSTDTTAYNAYSLTVNNVKVDLMVSTDEASKEKGLGGRDSIPENSSMLFIFDKPEKYGIWMKDMKFNIDIVWLNAEKRIVHIEKDVSPDTYPDVFFPPEDSLYIMEFNAGFSDKNMLSVGNVLDIIKN